MLAEPVLIGLGEVGGGATLMVVVRRMLVGRCGACRAEKCEDQKNLSCNTVLNESIISRGDGDG